jgi:hypothetical protein
MRVLKDAGFRLRVFYLEFDFAGLEIYYLGIILGRPMARRVRTGVGADRL